MLILTRRAGEVIRIGEEIAITVLRIKGNQVRIGIDAPKSLPVRREELDGSDNPQADGVPRPEVDSRE